jgi:hypothetical protein
MNPENAKQVADGINAIIAALNTISDALGTGGGEQTPPPVQPPELPQAAPEPQQAAAPPPKEPVLTEADVRKVLAGKSKDGFTKEVKELLSKYGTKMISELDTAHYAAVIAEAEEIG